MGEGRGHALSLPVALAHTARLAQRRGLEVKKHRPLTWLLRKVLNRRRPREDLDQILLWAVIRAWMAPCHSVTEAV